MNEEQYGIEAKANEWVNGSITIYYKLNVKTIVYRKYYAIKKKERNQAEEEIFRSLVEPRFCYVNGTNFMLAETVHYAERRVNMTN